MKKKIQSSQEYNKNFNNKNEEGIHCFLRSKLIYPIKKVNFNHNLE